MTPRASTLPELADHLTVTAAEFRDVLASADLDATVPSCPGWRLADLAGHLGAVYRLATAGIVDKAPLAPGAGPVDEGRTALLDWFDSGYARLLTALTEHSWDEECWTFGPKPATVAFWVRRQAHETVVHTWDAQLAASGKPAALDPNTSIDGIDEVITMFLPRQVRRGLVELPVSIGLSSTEGPSYVIGEGEPIAEVTGSAETLLLLLYRRITPETADVTITGDADAARRTLAAALTP